MAVGMMAVGMLALLMTRRRHESSSILVSNTSSAGMCSPNLSCTCLEGRFDIPWSTDAMGNSFESSCFWTWQRAPPSGHQRLVIIHRGSFVTTLAFADCPTPVRQPRLLPTTPAPVQVAKGVEAELQSEGLLSQGGLAWHASSSAMARQEGALLQELQSEHLLRARALCTGAQHLQA